MNRNFYLIATISLLIATTCFAMENKPKILFELATAPAENFAALVSNDRCIINGKKNCRIIDITTNTPVQIIEDTPIDSSIALYPNREYFALFNSKKIIIYDTKTGIEKWMTPWAHYGTPICTFSPSDDTIFAWNNMGSFKYLSQHNYNVSSI